MSKINKRKWHQVRKEFKSDLYQVASHNKSFAMMIISTYTASQHRTHIHKIWAMFRSHPRFAQAYNENLMGKHLTGRDEIMRALYFANRDLYNKYIHKIPECYAMGEALGVAYRTLKNSD